MKIIDIMRAEDPELADYAENVALRHNLLCYGEGLAGDGIIAPEIVDAKAWDIAIEDSKGDSTVAQQIHDMIIRMWNEG